MSTITKNKYYVLPDTEDGFTTLTGTNAVSSDGAGLNLTGYQKIINVWTTGAITVMAQNNVTLTGDFWTDVIDQVWEIIGSDNRQFRLTHDIEGDIRTVITGSAGIKVKVRIDQYTITGNYVTVPQYRSITKVSTATIGDDVLVYYLAEAHEDVIRSVGSDKTSADDFWRQIQKAEAFLATHYGAIAGWEIVPIDRTAAKETSSQWKEEYRSLILSLTGQDPFPDMDDINKLDGAYEAKISTITPDEDSYVTSTTR